jgi:hypothetical protein
VLVVRVTADVRVAAWAATPTRTRTRTRRARLPRCGLLASGADVLWIVFVWSDQVSQPHRSERTMGTVQERVKNFELPAGGGGGGGGSLHSVDVDVELGPNWAADAAPRRPRTGPSRQTGTVEVWRFLPPATISTPSSRSSTAGGQPERRQPVVADVPRSTVSAVPPRSNGRARSLSTPIRAAVALPIPHRQPRRARVRCS